MPDFLAGLMTGQLQASATNNGGPLDDRYYNVGGVMTAAGLRIDAEGARKISAWYRGRDILATSLAMLPLQLYRTLSNGDREIASHHPLYDILHRKPNASTDAFQWKRQAMFDVIDAGWHYARLIAGGRGFVDELRRIDPRTVTPEQLEDGRWLFTWRDPKGRKPPVVYTQDELFYLRGADGKGILDYARDSLGLGLTLETYASKLFSRGAMNGGVIKTPGAMPDKEAMRSLAQQFQSAMLDWHMPRVLPLGADFVPAQMEPEKAQMILSRKFSVVDIARWLGLPAHMLNEVDTAGVTGLEQKGQEFVTFSLGGWLSMWEFAINDQLILAPQVYFAEFTRDALARGSLLDRWTTYVSSTNAGIRTPNEVRRLENMPAKEGGDTLREPQNITGKGAKGGAQDNQRPGQTGDGNANARAEMIAVQSATRLLKNEVRAVQRLAVKHANSGDAFAAAITEFYAGFAAIVTEALLLSADEAQTYCASQAGQALGGWVTAVELWQTDSYAQGLAALALESEAA